MLAHELRGSAHGALGFVSVLLNGTTGQLTEVQIDFLQSIALSIRRIARLSDDLDVLAAEGTIHMQPSWIDLSNHVANCVRELHGLATNREIRVEVQVPETGRCMFWADPVRIEQIVLNLLENAIRYAPSPTTVYLRLRCSSSRVLFTVQNQTIDHDPVNPAAWLAPFARGNVGSAQHSRGHGLGLTICQALVAAHYGRLLIRAKRDTVTVGVTLPRRFDPQNVRAGMSSAPRPTVRGRPTQIAAQSRHHLEGPTVEQ